MKYLYGASVQGIQGFIFETNKLQEIVGASEIVKSIADDFEAKIKKLPVTVLVNAAGNIKAIFETKEACEEVVLNFGKEIAQKAYGITISQAVVKMEKEYVDEQKAINRLEEFLKIQRNKPSIPLDMSLNIMKLNPKTAKPLFAYDKRDEPLDRASKQKREAYNRWFNKQREHNPNFKELKELDALSNGKNKLAVVYADGNGLGELIPDLKKKLNISLSDFSKKLDRATEEAFLMASRDIEKIKSIILGGDDLVVICDANDALTFTKDFLYHFEKETEAIIDTKLTACAGIAYTNEKYPFHYAVSLAEDLCSETKKHAKKLREKEELKYVPSSLMFHNIQSSNYQTWSKFVEDELTIINDKCSIRCDFGPYYLDEKNQPKIEDFLNTVKAYACDGSPISRLRNWLNELGKSSEYSTNLLNRINTMVENSNEWNCEIMNNNLTKFDKELSNKKLIIKKDRKWRTPIYDILQILSVTEAK